MSSLDYIGYLILCFIILAASLGIATNGAEDNDRRRVELEHAKDKIRQLGSTIPPPDPIVEAAEALRLAELAYKKEVVEQQRRMLKNPPEEKTWIDQTKETLHTKANNCKELLQCLGELQEEHPDLFLDPEVGGTLQRVAGNLMGKAKREFRSKLTDVLLDRDLEKKAS